MAPCPVTGDALARLLPAGMNYSPVWPPHFLTGKSPAVFPENGSSPAEGLTAGVHRLLAALGWAVGKRSCCTIGAIRFMGGTTRHWAPGASVEPPLQCPSLWVIVRSWGGHAKALPHAPLPPPLLGTCQAVRMGSSLLCLEGDQGTRFYQTRRAAPSTLLLLEPQCASTTLISSDPCVPQDRPHTSFPLD